MDGADGTATIDWLPDELLFAVFYLLDPRTTLTILPRTCNRWRTLSRKLAALPLDLRFVQPRQRLRWASAEPAGLQMLSDLVSFYPKTPTFQIADWKFGDAGMHVVAAGCSELRTLSVVNTDISDAGVAGLALRCAHLTTVDLSWCDVSDTGVVALSEHCYRIRSVVLEGCTSVTDISVAALASGCPDLTLLNLHCCEKVSSSGLLVLGDLKYLSTLDVRRTKVTEAGLEAFVMCDFSLSSLSLSITRLADATIAALGRHATFTALTLENCRQLTDDNVIALAQHCPKLLLLSLDLSRRITDISLAALGERCPLLEQVRFDSCFKLTDKGLEALASGCPRLTAVDFDGVHNGCRLVTDCGMLAIAKGCPDLSSADFSSTLITDNGLKILMELCPRLTQLNVVDCSGITASALQSPTVIAGGTRSFVDSLTSKAPTDRPNHHCRTFYKKQVGCLEFMFMPN